MFHSLEEQEYSSSVVVDSTVQEKRHGCFCDITPRCEKDCDTEHCCYEEPTDENCAFVISKNTKIQLKSSTVYKRFVKYHERSEDQEEFYFEVMIIQQVFFVGITECFRIETLNSARKIDCACYLSYELCSEMVINSMNMNNCKILELTAANRVICTSSAIRKTSSKTEDIIEKLHLFEKFKVARKRSMLLVEK